MVDSFGSPHAFSRSTWTSSMSAKAERYEFLRWGGRAFDNFRVVPPEPAFAIRSTWNISPRRSGQETGGVTQVFPDTLVGTDSHTTMVNALSVLGWGVGGIEAEAAMLGQPISMVIPEVIGFRFTGALGRGHRDRFGAHRHADAAQKGRRRQVRGVFRPWPRIRCRSRTAQPWRTWRRNMARRAASSPSIRTPSII